MLYARHSAWLSAVPERESRKGANPEQERRPQLSRREMLESEDRPVEMPPIEWGGYILNHLFEFGPTMAAGMGSGPITPSEVESWQRVIGIEFSPWEARLLLRLSREYLSESHRATQRDCPAPWKSETHQPERMLAAIDQRDAFRKLAKL